MNMHAATAEFGGVQKTATVSRRLKYNPRSDILDEVIAGFIWMDLNLPDDASLPELERFAHHLIVRIRNNANQAAVESELTVLQKVQFCRAADPVVIRGLASRAIAIVTGSQTAILTDTFRAACEHLTPLSPQSA